MSNLTTPAAGPGQEQLPLRVGLAGAANMRDLGGYRTEHDSRVRQGVLYRSDSPHRLAGEDSAAFAQLGIRTFIDLRSSAELDRLGRPPLGPAVRAYVHAPLRMAAPAARPTGTGSAGTVPAGTAPAGTVPAGLRPDGTLTLGKLYRCLVTQSGEELRTILRVLSDEQAYPVLVYCVAGKDRTGIVAALILALLGVPDETIAADYAASADSFARFLELCAQDGTFADLTTDQRASSSLFGAEAETMLSFLGWIRAEFGSVEALVAGFGVDGAAIASLRRNLLAAA